MNYLDKLIENCKIAKEATPAAEYKISSLDQLDELPYIKTGIYIIKQHDSKAEQTFNSFKEFKERKIYMCPKINKPNSVMYVGSSTTGIKKRLKQHLYQGAKGTYALHFNQWFEGDYEVNIKVYDNSNEVIQLIEDNISFSLKPAFGKMGGNNK